MTALFNFLPARTARWPSSISRALLALAVIAPTFLRAGDLRVSASASPATVNVGANIVFTLRVTNAGPSDAASVVLSNALSARTAILSATTTMGTCLTNAGLVSCQAASLAAGAQFTVTITARAGAGTNSCSAQVSAAETDAVPGNNTAFAAAVGTITLAPLTQPDSIIFDEIDSGPGSVYPSTITVSGLTSQVHKVTVTLHTVAHASPDDLDILLVGPRGQNVLLMSDCGLNNSVTDITLTLDDDAAAALPDSDPVITSGTYRPSNYGSVVLETLDPPAPGQPYGTELGVFRGTNPNGQWRLYALDDSPEDGGYIADGWTLRLITSDPIADLSLGQRANVASLPVGSNLFYTVSVTNHGPAATTATVTDTLPPSVNFVSASASQGSCSESGGIVTCNLGNLLSGATAQITVVTAPTLGGQITNRVVVSGGEADQNPSNNIAAVVSTVIPLADVAVSINAPESELLLQPATWVISVANYGPNTATGVVLSNILPAGVTFLSATPSQGACTNSGGVVICQLGSLAATNAATVTIVGRPSLLGPNTNIARVVTADLEFLTANNASAEVTEIIPAADLLVTAVPETSTVPFGLDWTQTFFVTNRGPSTAAAMLTTMLTPVMNFVSATASQGSCTNQAGIIACDLGLLATNQIAFVTLVTHPTALAVITNVASVSGGLPDVILSNNTARAIAQVQTNADLTLVVSGPAYPAWVGAGATFTLVVSNLGSNSATGLALTNVLPASLNFVSAVASQGTCAHSNGILSCSLGALAPGGTANVSLMVQPLSAGFITNTARVVAVEKDSTPANNTAAGTLQAIAASSQFSSASVAIPDAGPAAPYPSTIQVSGLTASVFRVRVVLTNLAHTFPDDLDLLLVGPGGQTVLLLSDAGGEFAVTNLTLTFDADATGRLPNSTPLTAGAWLPSDHEVAADAFPPSAPPAPYGTNLAVFQGTNPNGLWSLFVVDDATKDAGSLGAWSLEFSTLDPIADLIVHQHFTANPVALSSNLVVTYTITNLGPAVATDVRLTNALDAALGFISAVPSQGACTNDAGQLTCVFGGLASGSNATVVLTFMPTNVAGFTNTVVVSAPQTDLRPENNVTAARVEIEVPPVITLHPIGLTATNGDTVMFTADATGTAPLSLQWQRNGINVLGATNAMLTIASVTPNHAGNYRLRAANRVGVALSEPALLRVYGPPTISDLLDLAIDEDMSTGPIAFSVEDAETAVELITITGSSSDTNLVPNIAIVFGGTGSNRTVQVSPRPNAHGQATISVTATDAEAQSTTRSFVLTVRPVNDSPTLGSVTNRTTDEDTPIVISFQSDDFETLPGNLTYALTSSDPALVPANGVLFGGAGSSRILTITPGTNLHGVALLALSVSDGTNVTAASFQLTVAPVNDRPGLNSIADQSVAEDSGPRQVTLTGLGSGATDEVQHLMVSARSANPALVPHPALAYTSPGNTAQLTFTSATNGTGSALITVTVTDGGTSNEVSIRAFTVTVTPVNDPPVIVLPATVVTDEDSFPSIPIALSDPDDAPALLGLAATSSNQSIVPNSGLLAGGAGAHRSLVITPALSATGTVAITVIATDPQGATTTNSFPLTLVAVNDSPTLNAIADRSIAEDAPAQNVPLTGIGAGAANESQPLTVSATSSNPSLISNPSITYTSPAATGTLTFAPNPNVTGSALISVTVSDGLVQFQRTFAVTVGATNDPPSITAIANQETDEDAPLLVPFTVGDAETPAALLTLAATSSNSNLVAVAGLAFDGSASNRFLIVTPRPNQSGTTTVTVAVSDGTLTNTAAFLLTVNALNDPPTLNPIPTFVTNSASGNPAFAVTINGISSGATNESQTLSVTATSGNPGFIPNPTVTYSSANTNGSVTLRPPNNATGSALITVTVNDNAGSNNTISRSFTANIKASGNVPPTLSVITNRVIAEDTATPAIAFTARDATTPASSLIVAAFSSNPALLPTNNIALGGAGTNRTITLTPSLNLTGLVAVTLTVTDDAFGSSNMTFNLTVTNVNDAPVISAIANRSTLEDTSIAVPFTVADVETPASALNVTATSGNTSLVPNGSIVVGGSGTNRALFITPAANLTGNATITVRVTDGAATNTTPFQLTVTATNDSPTLSPIGPVATTEDTPIAPINFTVGDVETAAGTLSVSAVSSNPSLIAPAGIALGGSGANRTLTLTPQPDAHGSASITVTVTDGGGAMVSESFAVTVAPVNDPPSLDSIADLIVNQGTAPAAIALTGIGSGNSAESQSVSVTAAAGDTNLLAVLSVAYAGSGSTGTLTLQPVPGATGAVQVIVTVDDGQTANNLASRAFTVTINAAPVISYVPDQATLEDVPTGAIPFAVSDAESPAGQLAVTVTTSSPLVPPANITLGGSNSMRTVTLRPATNSIGLALITITATDPGGASSSNHFFFSVTSLNVPPTLDPLPNLLVNPGPAPIPVMLTGLSPGGSNETETVVLNATSSDTNVFAIGGLVHTNGPVATVSLLAMGTNGSAVITVTANDGQAASNLTTRSFTATINTAPSLTSIAARTTRELTPTAPIAFTIGDAEHGPTQLAVSASSPSPLAPSAALTLDSSGARRTLVIAPAAGSGEAMITVTVVDPLGLTASASFLLTVLSNAPPTLDAIPDLVVNAASAPRVITLTGISSGATNEIDLVTLTVASSDTNLFAITSLDYSNGAATATLTLTPLGTNGAATITVTANDGQPTNNLITRTFIAAFNTPPVVSPIGNQFTPENTATAPIPFTVADVETPVDQLVFFAVSSSPLVPSGAFAFAGAGSNRTVVVAPATGQFGTALVTVVAIDAGGLVGTAPFTLTVTHDNVPPTLDPFPDRIVNPGTGAVVVAITGLGPGAPGEADGVTLTAASSDTNRIVIAALDHTNGASTAVLTLLTTGTNGSAVITVTANDGQATSNLTSRAFTVTLNTPPTISMLTNQVIVEDILSDPQPFTVGDAETPAVSLAVSASSSFFIVPDSQIYLAGTGSNRAVSILGLTNHSGIAFVTITVTDAHGLSASNTFEVFLQAALEGIEIIQQPQTVETFRGRDAAFSVQTYCAIPVFYQWRKDGIALPGATNATLLLTLVGTNDAGFYSVLLSNNDGITVSSHAAELIVHGDLNIIAITRTGTTARIFFVSDPGSTNTLEFKTPLTETNWTALTSIVATNGLLMLPDLNATNDFRFYRIRKE